MGFPLCGDVLYGGAKGLPHTSHSSEYQPGYVNSEKLGLHCCELEFLDPDYYTNAKGHVNGIRSDRWNTFRLEDSWWSPLLSSHSDNISDAPTTTSDYEIASTIRKSKKKKNQLPSPNQNEKNTPNIRLSPGSHKYVIIKAMQPGFNPTWFVKSASPVECGGLYHADVAKDIVKELGSKGYDTIVTGGGRIDYDPERKHATVFGFSYGFGKGDHEFVSLLIAKDTEISSTFDNSDSLY